MARRSDRAAHWCRVFTDWRRSGLTAAAFCRRRKVSTPSFYFWKRRLAATSARPAFLPVHVVDDALPASSRATIELVLRVWRLLRLTADVGPREIAALAGALEALPC